MPKGVYVRKTRIRNGWPEYRATENTPWRSCHDPYLSQRLKWDLHFDVARRVTALEEIVKEMKTTNEE